jgi:hypothetical protein
VHRIFLLLLLLVPGLLLAACGDDDVDSADGGDDATADATREDDGGDGGDEGDDEPAGDGDDEPADGGEDEGDDEPSGGGGGADIPELDDGVYEGEVHVEISGDHDETIDAEGSAFVQGGFALFTFGDTEATVILSFGDSEEPGALSITTGGVSTAGEWGTDCEITVEESDTEINGEFSCSSLDALEIGGLDELEINVNGSFTTTKQ